MVKPDIFEFDDSLYSSEEGLNSIVKVIEAEKSAFLVVVIAPSKEVKKDIEALISFAVAQDEVLWAKLEEMSGKQYELITHVSSAMRKILQASIRRYFKEMEDILRSVWLVQHCSTFIKEHIIGLGSIWTAELLYARLGYTDKNIAWLDSRKILTFSSEKTGQSPDWKRSREKLDKFLSEKKGLQILIATGSRGSNILGETVALGEHCAEFAASLYGNLLNAGRIILWSRLDGIMSADTGKVPGAIVIPELSYEEANELAHFGAEILHPESITPAILKNIPIHIKNINHPEAPGSVIKEKGSNGQGNPVKGFSIVDDISLLNVEGSGMVGVPGISSRLFTALNEKKISLILISQASSEHSICCAIPSSQAEEAGNIARKVFSEELENYSINTIDIEPDCAILGAVGDRMSGTPGISAKFFGALGQAGVNVRAIAQGSSERNISAVIAQGDSIRALRAVHSGFYLSNQTLSIGVIGPGLIGSTLLDQIAGEAAQLHNNFGIDLRVRGITKSTKMILSDPSLNMEKWRENLESSGEEANLDKFINYIDAEYIPHKVIIDCTTSPDIPGNYIQWIKRGIHIITPNKKAGTTPMPEYRELFKESRKRGTHFLYETTVGAGLPIIGTLRDLILTGDKIKRIEGVFSGTLAYLFWRFDGTQPFSELVQEAKELGFTEPDPRDDLSGMDIVRKTVILAREIGYSVEIEEVPVKSLVPPELENVPVEEFMKHLSVMDGEMDRLHKEAAGRNEALKYTGIIGEDGQCRVMLKSYPQDHPFAGISGSDNIVAFTTERYNVQPLVVRGPGAGPEVTAGGIFADLLRLASYLGAKL